MKKTLFSIMCAVLSLLLLTACGSAPTTQQNNSPSAAAPQESATSGPEGQEAVVFDEKLPGAWRYYGIVNEGEVSQYSSTLAELINLQYFTFSGIMSTKFNIPYDKLCLTNTAPLVLCAEDGKMDYVEKLLSFLVRTKADGAEAEERKYSNIVTTYELFDACSEDTAGSGYISDVNKAALDEHNDDGLRIHVTADYQKDPLTSQKVDFTFLFYKEHFNDKFVKACFVGDWTDSAGNSWAFQFEQNEYLTLMFSMKDPEGTTYKGKSFSYSELDGSVTLYFEDFSSPKYALELQDVNTIHLASDSGSIILTRN